MDLFLKFFQFPSSGVLDQIMIRSQYNLPRIVNPKHFKTFLNHFQFVRVTFLKIIHKKFRILKLALHGKF